VRRDPRLHQHPFASYCQKTLIALYERELPFSTQLVDDAHARAKLAATLWPMATIPFCATSQRTSRSRSRRRSSSTSTTLPPTAPSSSRPIAPEALQARLGDRFYDQHVANPMQKIVTDRLRPAGRNDPEGLVEARNTLDTAYTVLDAHSPNGPRRPAPRSPWPTAPPRRRCSTREPSTAGTSTARSTSPAITAT
jgi:glutathione S-transferase